MNHKFRKAPYRLPRLILLFLLIGLLVPPSIARALPAIEVIVEEPTLTPPYDVCEKTAWMRFANDRGHYAYLTLNVDNPGDSTNYGEWRPVIPQTGYYRVEAYIAGHGTINWCTSGVPKEHDTTDAHYSIYHAKGVSNREVSQYPLSNQWLDLGEYYFSAGDTGYVGLKDLNNETNFSTTVSFSAMRFTYTRAWRPDTSLPIIGHAHPPGTIPPDVGIIQAQGFDVCSLPSISTMQTWWNSSPYKFYGLYLGGVQLAPQCAEATSTWVGAVHQQGWSFIPVWVGPQAPCTSYSFRINEDPAIAYQEGRQEAQLASIAAASKGLTNNDLGGTIIYYDMEAYGFSSSACRQPVAAFMNGWVQRLHELGNLAGGYGTRNSYVADWAYIPNVPDDVWPASWYATYYDPYASVTSIPWLDGLWVNHQRIRQYAGDHHESWGGVGMGIDSDVADGTVAMPPNGPQANPIIISSPTVQDTGWLSATQGWLVTGGHLYWTADRGSNWTDISPTTIQIAYFLPGGQAWALSNLDELQPAIYYSTDGGASWDSYPLTLPAVEWIPLQLQFNSPTQGWAVLQKVSSQAFQKAIFIKTGDGGLTWQTYDLPVVGKISFNSQSEGWLLNTDRQQAFHTTDGGLSWQAAEPRDYPSVNTTLPAGTALSGWSAGNLGWATTSNGSCVGEKRSPGFTCQLDNQLWQSVDNGKTWELIPLPEISPNKR